MPDTTASPALSSMTGFAARQGAGHGWSWSVDMRSVNGRGLDLRFRVPDWIEGLEPDLRRRMQGRLHRGTITVAVRLQRDAGAQGVALNAAALDGVLDILRAIDARARSRGIETRPPSAADIAICL